MTRALEIDDAAMAAATQAEYPHLAKPWELANEHVRRFVHRIVRECVPDRIYWCNGSDYERRKLTEEAAREGLEIKTDHVGAEDVARGGRPTIHCKPDCMVGRTMYVVPFLTETRGGATTNVGVTVTDSVGLALDMGGMTRIGDVALRRLGKRDEFERWVRVVGR